MAPAWSGLVALTRRAAGHGPWNKNPPTNTKGRHQSCGWRGPLRLTRGRFPAGASPYTWPARSGFPACTVDMRTSLRRPQAGSPRPISPPPGLDPRGCATSSRGISARSSWPPPAVALQWAPGGWRRLRAFRSGAVARLTLDVKVVYVGRHAVSMHGRHRRRPQASSADAFGTVGIIFRARKATIDVERAATLARLSCAVPAHAPGAEQGGDAGSSGRSCTRRRGRSHNCRIFAQ